jgi:hypothetical protein
MKRAQRVGLLSLAVGVAVIAYAQQRARRELPQLPARDYSGRSGFPRGVEASRGLAATAALPKDFMIPAALRPLA